jgi:hypothetical protein
MAAICLIAIEIFQLWRRIKRRGKKMDDKARAQLVARSAASFAARRLAVIEEAIATRGLRPDSAAELWRARAVVAETRERLAALSVAPCAAI